MKFTQPVLVQNLEGYVSRGKDFKTPSVAGQVLVRGDGSGMMGPVEITHFGWKQQYACP